jgi:hypothetical protein
MDISSLSIIQRAGIVPLSIAGIFKEVSTITISSLVFGDQLTAINNVGVVITIGGKLTPRFRLPRAVRALKILPQFLSRNRSILFPQVPKGDADPV